MLLDPIRRVCLIGVTLLVSMAGGGAAQEMDSTRWTDFTEQELEAFATDLFSTISVHDPGEAAAHVVEISDGLELGDEAQLYFRALYQGNHATLYIDLVDDIVTYVRVRGSGKVFTGAEGVFRQHWLRSLLAIEGPLELSVGEVVPASGRVPELVLSVQTEREFSCLGFGIEGEVVRREGPDGQGLLRLQLLGISTPGSICPPALGPAEARKTLPTERGRYILRVTYAGQADEYLLVVTDSTARLFPERMSFTNADTRLKLRFPPNSFAFYCGTTGSAASLCTDIHRWLVSQLEVEPITFPAHGVIPYKRGIGTPHKERHYYRYTSEQALETVRRCFSRIQDQVREAVGISLAVETWKGQLIRALSERAYHERHIEAPEQVTTSCVSHQRDVSHES